jgi:ATP-dependent helicase HepA
MSFLRYHLSETYRLDRRILRNRRAGVPGLTPDRAGVTFIDFKCSLSARLTEAIEMWRSETAFRLYDREETPEAELIADWFANLLEATLSDRSSIARLTDSLPRIAGLTSPFVFEGAGEALTTDETRMAALASAITEMESDIKFVIFCSAEWTGNIVAEYLSQHLGVSVDRPDGASEDENTAVFARFLEDPSHRILVCDRSHEEGLNLQGGDKVIIHFDLPFAPNRIEQRVGRLDRYGSGAAIRSLVLRCLDNPLEQAWCACLADGLGVFNHSIASLQYLVDLEMQKLRRSLLTDGIEAVTALTNRLGGPKGEVAQELLRIDQQDQLDALMSPTDDTNASLFAIDSDWQEFQRRVESWIVDILQMTRERGPEVGPVPPGDNVARFGLVRVGRKRTLIPLDRFVESMLPALDLRAPHATSLHPLTYPYTCRRQTALKRRSRNSGVRLLRYGEAFLQGLDAITALDDRGRSVAMWRTVPGYKASDRVDVFLRFNFIVEPNTEPAAELYRNASHFAEQSARSALSRRGDMVFPPFFHRLWLDSELQAVEDAALLAVLEAPYDKGRPTNGYSDRQLNHRRWKALKDLNLPIMGYWPSFVEQARAAAEKCLHSRAVIAERAQQAVAKTKLVDDARFTQLRARIGRDDAVAAEADGVLLQIEQNVTKALYEGILAPRISLDTIGAMFLAGQGLESSLLEQQQEDVDV